MKQPVLHVPLEQNWPEPQEDPVVLVHARSFEKGWQLWH